MQVAGAMSANYNCIGVFKSTNLNGHHFWLHENELFSTNIPFYTPWVKLQKQKLK